MATLEARPDATNGVRYLTLYRDAADAAPHGARWKALFAHHPGETTGLPVRRAGGGAAEWRSLGGALRDLRAAYRSGDVFAFEGYVTRAWLARFEGRGGWRWLHNTTAA